MPEKNTPTARTIAKAAEETTVLFGEGRSVKFRKPDFGEYFKLCGIMGNVQSTEYKLMAQLAYRISNLDGVPVIKPDNVDELAKILSKLTVEGYYAIMEHIEKTITENTPDPATLKN